MRNLVITIPIGEHQETIETLYAIGVKMKVSGNQIFVDCVNGYSPEALDEIDRDFAVELTADKPVAAEHVGDRIVIPQFEVMG